MQARPLDRGVARRSGGAIAERVDQLQAVSRRRNRRTMLKRLALCVGDFALLVHVVTRCRLLVHHGTNASR